MFCCSGALWYVYESIEPLVILKWSKRRAYAKKKRRMRRERKFLSVHAPMTFIEPVIFQHDLCTHVSLYNLLTWRFSYLTSDIALIVRPDRFSTHQSIFLILFYSFERKFFSQTFYEVRWIGLEIDFACRENISFRGRLHDKKFFVLKR